VDAGGTSTRAVLVEDSGRCLGYGTAGGGNPVSWGAEQAARSVGKAVAGALAQAGMTGPLDVGVVTLAMAGGTSTPSLEEMQAALRGLGLTGTVVPESDLLATFCAGTPSLQGYALVSGTGAAAIRVCGGSTAASADGLGWLLGDEGSGFWIGHRVARAAAAALDGWGPATRLSALLLQELGITDDGRTETGRSVALAEAVRTLYRGRPVELSRFAALAFRAAGVSRGDGETPDPVAVTILQQARSRLVAVLGAVRRDDVVGPVVLGGGIARRLPGLADAIADSVGSDRRVDVVIVADGAVGAGVLALRRAGIAVDRQVFDRLVSSVAQLR